MLAPDRLVKLVLEITNVDGIHVYWCRVDDDDRDGFARSITDLAVNVVPIVVRKAIFTDPNSVLSDLNRLLDENRAAFERCCTAGESRIVVLLLARNNFALSQTGSPIVLPDWMPVLGGQEVFVRVRDFLTDVDSVLLNAPEARVDDLASKMFEVETLLVARIIHVYGVDPRHGASVLGRIATLHKVQPQKEAIQGFFDGYNTHLQNVADPRAYRPSAGHNNSSFLADMVRLLQRSTPDELAQVAKALAEALALPAESSSTFRAPLVSTLWRPTMKLEREVGFAHTVVLMLFASYQMLTASAHASEYPKFPVEFLFSFARDLRRGLADATLVIRSAPNLG